MKGKFFFLFGLLSLIACDDVIHNDPDVPLPPKYPFESLDEMYFNQTSAQLNYPETLLRLDSVVIYHYYRFNPETGVSDYQWYTKTNTTYAPPPPEPTNRMTEVFHYDTGNKLERIEIYREESDNQTTKGVLLYTTYFTYDANNNLIRRGDSLEENNNFTEYFYNERTLVGYKSTYNANEEEANIQHDGQNIIVSTNDYTTTLTIDSYKNLIKCQRNSSYFEHIEEYKYPKNIISPYYKIFPYNFISHLYWNSMNPSGSTHFSSGPSTSFIQKIQLNEFYYPEIVQTGSYDDGYRTKYYYSMR